MFQCPGIIGFLRNGSAFIPNRLVIAGYNEKVKAVKGDKNN